MEKKITCDSVKCQLCEECVFDGFHNVHGGLFFISPKNSTYEERLTMLDKALKECPGNAIKVHRQ